MFSGAFAKLPKATLSFVMSICPSARMEQLGSHWTISVKFGGEYFSNICREFQVSLNPDKNDGYFT